MRRALLKLSEGRSLGIFNWYAKQHLKKCPQCTATFKALLSMRQKLNSYSALKGTKLALSEDRWKQIETACRETEAS